MMPLLLKSQSNFLLPYPLLKPFKDRWEPCATAGVPLVLLLLLLLLPFYGRNKKHSLLYCPLAVFGGLTENNSQTSQNASLSSKGKSLFRSEGCTGCHRINGSGGRIGPNLSNIGSERLSRQWLTVQIMNPKKHNPESIMPSFTSLSNENLNALLTYIESLKGPSEPTVSSQSSGSPEKSTVGSQAGPSTRQSQYPGTGTYKFIAITIAGFAIAVLFLVVLWLRFMNGPGSYKPGQTDQRPEGQTSSFGKDLRSDNQRLRISSEEDKSTNSSEAYHKKQESDESSTSFALIVIIIVAIITTALILIFSAFVTTKPIPSVTTQHISFQQKSQTGDSVTNTGQPANDQQKKNED